MSLTLIFIAVLAIGLVNSDPNWGSNGNQRNQNGFQGSNQWRSNRNPWGTVANQDGFGEGGNQWRSNSNQWGAVGNQWNQDGFGERHVVGVPSWRQGTGTGNFGAQNQNQWGQGTGTGNFGLQNQNQWGGQGKK